MQLTLRQRWPRLGESRHWWIARRDGTGQRTVIDLTIGPDDRAQSYTQMLWMDLRKKAAYLPG